MSVDTVVFACQVLREMLDALLPRELRERLTLMDYGLHRVPAELSRSLQEALDDLETPSLVVLGFGLCGNGLHGLRAGRHTLLVPRVNDCIAMLLGSHQAYLREFQREPGTYYLSKGWLEAGSDPLREYERYVPLYGEEEALWVMDQQYQHYRRLAFVAHREEDLAAYRPRALEVARFCERWGMRYEEILGSDALVRRLVELAGSPQREDDDFLWVPPGGELRQDQFWR